MNKKLQQLKAPKKKQLQATKLSVEGRGIFVISEFTELPMKVVRPISWPCIAIYLSWVQNKP